MKSDGRATFWATRRSQHEPLPISIRSSTLWSLPSTSIRGPDQHLDRTQLFTILIDRFLYDRRDLVQPLPIRVFVTGLPAGGYIASSCSTNDVRTLQLHAECSIPFRTAEKRPRATNHGSTDLQLLGSLEVPPLEGRTKHGCRSFRLGSSYRARECVFLPRPNPTRQSA